MALEKLAPMGTAEAMEALGVSKDTLLRMIARGEIRKAHKMPGLRGPYILDRAEIETLVAKAAS